jgi:hypothetical protein
VTTRLLGALLAAAAVGLVLAPDRAHAAETITAHCTPAPENCSGWYRTNVTVQWTWDAGGLPQNCPFLTITADTPGTAVRCSVSFNGDPARTLEVTIRRDGTPPQVTGAAAARGPDQSGWYNRAVAVTFTGSDATSGIASCTSLQYAGPDGPSRDVNGTCTDAAGNTSAPGLMTLKYDATPPAVSAAPARDPDANGWFNHAVAVTATGTDPVSGVASCSSQSYSGPDSAAASVKATCTDNAGNTSAPVETTLKYDATGPTTTAKVNRDPDGNGWYRRPLKVTFSGTDATSGVAGCTAPAEYKGPDDEGASLAGTCRDTAGNESDASVDFKYDSTAPRLAVLAATSSNGLVRVAWKRTAGATSIELVRSPGLRGAVTSIVYRGTGLAFADRSVQNGRTYRYVLRVADSAGNVATKSVQSGPRPSLYRPAFGAVVHAPLTLAWQATDARFYNLQVLRDGLKVLSVWPRASTFVIPSTWRFGGKTFALDPGTYRWYVWGAHGTKERPQYGRPLGTSTFVVKKGR